MTKKSTKSTKPVKPIVAKMAEADKVALSYEKAVAAAKVNGGDTIASAAEKLLTRKAFTADKRNWGIPYKMILAEILRVFPEAETTIACLRWYAVKLNDAGVKLPHRKRSRKS